MNSQTLGAGLLVLTSSLVLSLGACEKKPAAPTPAPQAQTPAAPEPDAVYVVRGVVVQIPDPANPTKNFQVHHEAIPDFKGPDGKVVGMGEMIMPFPVDDPALLNGIAIGDKVEITFADWYQPLRTIKVTKLIKLPADTALELKNK